VRGIGGYGNCVGVPTVGGEIYFDRAYEGNPPRQRDVRRHRSARTASAPRAAGARQPRALLGALTGRDGIGGASVLASADLDESAADKRPSVQIGDPFEEKKLIECCLELRIWGPLVFRRAPPRWPPRAASGSTSTLRACRSANRAWSRSR
jgi:phosphoribosylformylglycinamidine (FGAM) synthase-like enzyme